MSYVKFKQRAFSLIEILITIAIISILIAVASPSYARYTRKAHYTEIINATRPLKLAVDSCYQAEDDLTLCNSGANGIPAALNRANGLVAKAEVQSGVINVTPVAKYGIKTADVYILTPSVHDNQITWLASGKGVQHGYA